MVLTEEDKKRIQEEEKYRVSIRKQAEPRKQLGCGSGCLILILIFVGAAFFLVKTSPSSPPLTDEQRRLKDTTPTRSMATVMAEKVVKSALKAPSTASFPWLDVKSIDLGNGKFRVSSYVDAQNAFGAQIRSNWHVVLQHTGGATNDIRNWKVEDIQIK